MSYSQLPYLYTNVPYSYQNWLPWLQPYTVVDPYLDYHSYYTSPMYQYEYYNYTKDRYDDFVRNKSLQELQEIKQMREKIDALAKHAKEKELMIEVESQRLAKEKELVLMRLNDVKRKEEIATLEKDRLEDAKRNLNLRYASIPRRSDLYPWPYFREFYGGPLHTTPPVVHHSYAQPSCHHCHSCYTPETQTPQRCKQCYKEKTNYILPPIGNSRDSAFKISKTTDFL